MPQIDPSDPRLEQPENQSDGRSPRRLSWFWLGAFTGSVIGAAGVSLAIWGWLYIHKDLSPLISRVLTNYLDRPVALGEVEQVGIGSIQVGPSTVGASAFDPTTLDAESVTVRFDLLKTLSTFELGLDLIVVDAEGYLAQDPEKGWLNYVFPRREEGPERRFKIRLDEVYLEESQLTLVPLPIPNEEPEPIFLENVSGQLALDEVQVAERDVFAVRFEIEGDPIKGGSVELKGEVQPMVAPVVIESIADEDDQPEDSDAESNEEVDELLSEDATDENATDREGVIDSAEKTALAFATNLVVRADEAPLSDILSFTLSTLKLQTNAVRINAGNVSGVLNLNFRPQETVGYSGAVSVKDGELTTRLLPLPVKEINGQTQFKDNVWTIDQVSADYGLVDAIAEGLIDFNEGYYDLAAQTKDVTVAEFAETVDLDLPVPASGVFEAVARVDGPLARPVFTGLATSTSEVTVDEVVFDTASTGFQLQNQTLYLSDIFATPSVGGSLRGTGEVLLGEGSPFSFQFAGRNLPANAIAALYGIETNFQIGRVSADTTIVGRNGTVDTTVEWDAPNAEYAGSGTIDIRGSDLVFRNTVFAVGGGTVSGTGTLSNGLFESDVALLGVQLGSFSPDLRGDVSGQFTLSGSTDNLGLETITAEGDVAFSQGLASFSRQLDGFSEPLRAQVAWNGENIQVIEASSDRATASGTLTPNFENGFSLNRLDLQVNARDYAIAELPFELPTILAVQGRTDFNGTITGSPTDPIVEGSVNLTNLVVNSLPFSPTLTGRVAYASNTGVTLDVAGGGESILVNTGPLGQDRLPSFDFAVAWRGATASGQTQGDVLTLTAIDFPLATLNFPSDGVANIGQLRGTLSTNQLAFNLVTQSLEGDIRIDQLGLGYISGGQLIGRVSYANSIATIANGQVILNKGDNNPDNNTTYQLAGRLNLSGPEPVYSATLTTQAGNINSLLSAASIYRLEDFSRGLTSPDWLSDPISEADLDRLLATISVNDSDASQPFELNDQLNRLSEIQELQAESAITEESDLLPPLSELEGPFAGTFQLEGTGSEFDLGFDLVGTNWQWGDDYSADSVVARGNLTPNILVLQPVRFASVVSAENIADNPNILNPGDEAVVNLVGQIVFGQDTELQSDLQANARNIDAGILDSLFELPFDIEGLANATATLGGTLSNPQLRGRATLSSAEINGAPLETALATFVYQNAILSLQSSLTASTPERPLLLTGQIPYAFDFMSVEPSTDQLDIDISVQDEGLALLNIFNDQVAFESGSGQVNLTVDGTLDQPVIAGFASLSEAVLSAQILPEPLVNVTGQARFLGDLIVVDTLEGRIGQGRVAAAGTLPLRESGGPVAPLVGELSAASSSPLRVNLEDISLALANIYDGIIDGQLAVGGSLASGTEIGGRVLLSNGQIRLPDGDEPRTVAEADAEAELADDRSDSEFELPAQRPIPRTPGTINLANNRDSLTFRNLQLTLGDSIEITQGNLLNFVADGTLLLDGAPTALSPRGTINLRSGRVNLFTTLFRLSGDDNTATFTPETGLQNPDLDVSLRASVSEVNRATPIASTPFARSEIIDDTIPGFESTGSLQTIRVRADVEGPTNRIFENLELSSTPPRSQTELLGLIGSGVVTALESTVGSLSGSGDSFGGLINLVGSALLNNVQDSIVGPLNLSEFRLFPVTGASRTLSEEDNDTGIDLAAEVGFDVTDDLSLSIAKILTDSSNPEFGLNYRLSDSFTIRSNTNFDDINQVFLEYRIRF